MLSILVIHFLPVAWNDAVTTTVGTALILLSLIVVTGYSGQLSLAQFAFAGWGAWDCRDPGRTGKVCRSSSRSCSACWLPSRSVCFWERCA